MNKKRQAIWNKTNGKCWYCGCDLPEKGWHADHVDPVIRNWWDGTECHPENENIDNLVPTCASCNIQKGNMSVEEFRERIAGFVHSLNSYHTQYAVAKRYGLVKETNSEVKFWFERSS
jgi:5-methylcytosine-specific restriction endonuclease McrA